MVGAARGLLPRCITNAANCFAEFGSVRETSISGLNVSPPSQYARSNSRQANASDARFSVHGVDDLEFSMLTSVDCFNQT
jgi:hypothetical protein